MKNAVCAIITVLLLTGCVRLKGEFAFRKFGQDSYRRIEGSLEFEKNEKVDWVYIFRNLRGKYKIYISIIKKELIWIDIYNTTDLVSVGKNSVYGVIENLSDGIYKIILYNESRVIDEREFTIFTAEEEYYKYSDQ